MDKNEAIKILKPLFEQCKGANGCAGYIEHFFTKNEEEALDFVIKTLEEDRWTPVSERLPDNYGNYLVFTSDNDIDIGTYHSDKGEWSMCDANGFYWAGQKGIKITHWKPLPKFYESEEK